MAEALAITVSVIALVNTSRKTVAAIAKVIELRQATGILLALNNELVDLQLVIEDIDNLAQKFHDVLHEAFTPSFHRSIERTKEVLLALDALIAYRLTKPGGQDRLSRVDRSVWFRSQVRVERMMQDVRDCRINLTNAMAINTASISLHTFTESRRRGIQIEQFMTDNFQYHREIVHRSIGLRDQVDRAVTPAQSGVEPSDTAHNFDPSPNNASLLDSHKDDFIVPVINVRVLRRRQCHAACSCSCHQIQRRVLPGQFGRLMGSLFIGYTSHPCPFRRCDVYGCRQSSALHVKLAYRFPAWFWNRALHIAFLGGGLGPELVLRFPCVRPFESDWGKCVRDGAVEELKSLIENRQASLSDVDSEFGMTALHWSMHNCQVGMVSFLIRSGADWTAEDGFGLTPRHCLLFDCQQSSPGDSTRDERLLLSKQYSRLDNASASDLLEEPAPHTVYRGSGTHDALRASLKTPTDIHDADALGNTLLTKAIRWTDELTVRLLLEHGCSVTRRNRHGYTFVWVACAIGRAKIVQLLLDYGADPAVGTLWDPGFDAVAAAVSRDRRDVIRLMLEHMEGRYTLRLNRGSNILHVTARQASVPTIELLCAFKYIATDLEPVINCLDNGGATPHKCIDFRKRHTKFLTQERKGLAIRDQDPEQPYSAFMKLVQKIVDDHYGYEAYTGDAEAKAKTRMVAIPRGKNTDYLDILAQVPVEQAPDKDTDSITSDDSGWREDVWEDALEDLGVATDMLGGNEEIPLTTVLLCEQS